MSAPMRLDLRSDVRLSETSHAQQPRPLPTRSRTPILGNRSPLLVHATASQALTKGLVQRCAAAQLGAVYTKAKSSDMLRLSALHETHGAGPLLFDAEQYAGKKRDHASGRLDADWIRAQHASGLRYALTDSPYIPANELTTLTSVLEQGSRFPRSIIALPLAKRWFTHDADELARQISRISAPVALMAEDRKDPFASAGAVRGLIHVLDKADVPVVQLRCDLTAIGALAFGASHGAIGTSTTLRHIWPPSSGGPTRPAEVAAYVPHAMSYRSLATIDHAITHYPDDQVRWRCYCDICGGNTLDLIAGADQAALHSLLSLAELTDAVLHDPVHATQSWIERCRHARSINQEIEAHLIKNWPVPEYLNAWIAATS